MDKFTKGLITLITVAWGGGILAMLVWHAPHHFNPPALVYAGLLALALGWRRPSSGAKLALAVVGLIAASGAAPLGVATDALLPIFQAVGLAIGCLAIVVSAEQRPARPAA